MFVFENLEPDISDNSKLKNEVDNSSMKKERLTRLIEVIQQSEQKIEVQDQRLESIESFLATTNPEL